MTKKRYAELVTSVRNADATISEAKWLIGAQRALQPFATDTGIDLERLEQYRAVAHAFPQGTRVPSVSWSAHRALRSYPHLLAPGMAVAEAQRLEHDEWVRELDERRRQFEEKQGRAASRTDASGSTRSTRSIVYVTGRSPKQLARDYYSGTYPHELRAAMLLEGMRVSRVQPTWGRIPRAYWEGVLEKDDDLNPIEAEFLLTMVDEAEKDYRKHAERARSAIKRRTHSVKPTKASPKRLPKVTTFVTEDGRVGEEVMVPAGTPLEKILAPHELSKLKASVNRATGRGGSARQ